MYGFEADAHLDYPQRGMQPEKTTETYTPTEGVLVRGYSQRRHEVGLDGPTLQECREEARRAITQIKANAWFEGYWAAGEDEEYNTDTPSPYGDIDQRWYLRQLEEES